MAICSGSRTPSTSCWSRSYLAESPDAFERERLAMLRHLTDPITFRRLTHLGVGPGWRCLDVGAGDGTVARWLAGRVGPGGRVVATDINPRLLDGNGCPSLEIRRHEILEEGHYNLVHCRTLLLHLACSLRALVSTRPDG